MQVGDETAIRPPITGCTGSPWPRDLVGTGVQNLRAYERAGLLEPSAPPAAPVCTARTTSTGCGASTPCSAPASTSPGSRWCSPWRRRSPASVTRSDGRPAATARVAPRGPVGRVDGCRSRLRPTGCRSPGTSPCTTPPTLVGLSGRARCRGSLPLPLLQATMGSTHGYDTTDVTRVDPDRGGAEGLRRCWTPPGTPASAW